MQENTQGVYERMPPLGSEQEKIWYYEEKGSRRGPVSQREIHQLMDSQIISYDNYVWRQGYSDWLKISETELRNHLDRVGPPPLLGDNVNNTFVWVLAFAPILGTFLEVLIAEMLHGTAAMSRVQEYWYITLLLNILLCVLDERQLKKAGHNTTRFRGWIWLVPVYLFQRTKALHQNKSYFIVWIISFVAIILPIL